MLQANPKYYDLARALRDDIKSVSWGLKIHHRAIKKGNEVFLWISGPEGGLAAQAEAAQDPRPCFTEAKELVIPGPLDLFAGLFQESTHLGD